MKVCWKGSYKTLPKGREEWRMGRTGNWAVMQHRKGLRPSHVALWSGTPGELSQIGTKGQALDNLNWTCHWIWAALSKKCELRHSLGRDNPCGARWGDLGCYFVSKIWPWPSNMLNKLKEKKKIGYLLKINEPEKIIRPQRHQRISRMWWVLREERENEKLIFWMTFPFLKVQSSDA
jgi:hypothetical protein